MEGYLSYFFRTLSIYFFAFLFSSINAMELTGIYTTSCKREVGVIVKVSSTSVHLFNVLGEEIILPRYEITGLTAYPIEKFPVHLMNVSKSSIPIYKFKTKYNQSIIPMAEGWVIKHSPTRLSLLSTSGEEVSFDRNSIWDIQKENPRKNFNFKTKINHSYIFLHPTSLGKCPLGLDANQKKSFQIAPQEYVSDPIMIKRKLDSIIEYQTILGMYERSKDFYAIPQVYQNKTTLGLWLTGGSRHGASNHRTNNWAPIVENQFSSGPYGYQHVFYTGATTNQFFVHLEPQTQVYYRFKADYFHLAYFIDPSMILMGNRYRWFDDELGQNEYRLNDISFIEAGFDFSYFSLLFQISSETQIAYRDSDGYTFDGQLTTPKVGLELQNYKHGFNFLYGSSSENVRSDDREDEDGNFIDYKISKFELSVVRFNYFRQLDNIWKLQGSYIQRKLRYEAEEYLTDTLGVEVEYKLSYKYIFTLLIADEVLRGDKDSHFLKLGLNANLVF